MRKVIVVLLATVTASCISWQNRVTPSGGRCSDMMLVGHEHDNRLEGRTVHRLGAISAKSCNTTAECAEQLRKAACALDADVVVDVFTEADQVHLSGFAARFTGGK